MFNYSGRLFTFGCSMTSYVYPTWADILGKKFSHFENWGEVGAGNLYIFNSIVECINRNALTKDDTIIILWSGVSRIDYYQFNEWGHMTNVHVNDKKNGNQLISCPDGYEIISYAFFDAIDKLLSKTDVNFIMLNWSDYDSDSRAGRLYKDTLSKIDKFEFEYNQKISRKLPTSKLTSLYTRVSGTDWPKFDDIFSYDSAQYSSSINKEVSEFFNIVNTNKHIYYAESTIDPHPTW